MPLDPIIARGIEAPDLTRPLILAEEIKNRRESNKLHALDQQFRQQRYAEEQSQAKQAQEQAQAQEQQKQEALRVYQAAKMGNPNAKAYALKKLSEAQPGMFDGVDPEQAWSQIEPIMRQQLGLEEPAAVKRDVREINGALIEVPAEGAPQELMRVAPQPQQYAPAGYREMTLMEDGVPVVYMVNERNPSQRVRMGEGQAKGGGGAGVTIGPNGEMIVNPDPSKATEGERTSSNYADRMSSAETLLGTYKPSAKDYIAANSMMQGGATTSIAANSVLSPEGQRYYQAAADWVRAKLRKESGAVISPMEMAQEIKTYFPMPGDSDETIAQKAKARQQALQGMRGMAGRAATPQPQRPGQSSNKVVNFGDL